jgi:hypothetical protein
MTETFIIALGYIITIFYLIQAHSRIAYLENQTNLDQPDIYRRAKADLEDRLKPSIKLLNKCVQDIRYLSYRQHIKLGEVRITEVNQDDVFRVGELHPLCIYLHSHIQDFKMKLED